MLSYHLKIILKVNPIGKPSNEYMYVLDKQDMNAHAIKMWKC